MANRKKTRKPPKPKLTAKQRAQDRNPLYNPVRTLAGHELAAAADAVVDAQYGPKLAALGRQARSTETQGTALVKRASDYFTQLHGLGAGDTARQQEVAAQLRSGLQRVATDTEQANDRATGDVLDRLAADRANRGAGLEGGGERAVLDELAAQRARAADTAGAFRASGELQAGRAQDLQGAMAASTQARGGEVQQQLLNRLANDMTKVRAERSDLEGQRGDERVKQLLGLRQAGFENLVTQRGLQIKQTDLEADIANQIANRDLAAQRIRSTERQSRSRTRATLRGQSLSHADRTRGQDLTHADRQASLEQRQQAAAEKNRAQKNAGKEKESAVKIKRGIGNALTMLEEGHTDRYLTNVLGVPPDVLQAAKDLHVNNGVLRYDTYRMLKRLGVKVPPEWRPPKPDRSAPH